MYENMDGRDNVYHDSNVLERGQTMMHVSS